MAGKMFDPSFCHHCNVNKLDPRDKYYLPNGIEAAASKPVRCASHALASGRWHN
jgi:hypothetical protein